MKKKLILIVSVCLLTLSTFFFATRTPSRVKPEVLVTIAPHKYFVERLTHHQIEAKNLVPEVADPHGFEPAAKDLIELFEAKVWFLSGEPFEEQFIPILKKNNPNAQVVALKGDDHALHVCCSHHTHTDDLHFWMSPKIAKVQCQEIAEVLKEQFPELKEPIDENLLKLNEEFDALDAFLSEQLKEKHGQSFLVSHPAFGYFARDYHLHQLALENETQDPSPKEFAHLLNHIHEEKIKTLYVQKQYNYKASQQLAEREHLELVEVNPYAYDYFENLKNFGAHLGGQHD